MADERFDIVPQPLSNPMPALPESQLPEYVKRVMKENGWKYEDVARVAKRRGGSIGKSTIQQIATDKEYEPGIYTLLELSWGLLRPVEELIRAALGETLIDVGVFRKSDFAALWQTYEDLPASQQKAMKRYLQMMDREMRRTVMQLVESDPLRLEK